MIKVFIALVIITIHIKLKHTDMFLNNSFLLSPNPRSGPRGSGGMPPEIYW
jgi:hypothetical protein